MLHVRDLNLNIFRRFDPKKEIRGFYVSNAIKSFAESFVKIFIPIYLLTLGYELRDVAFFYFVYFSTVGFTMPFFMNLGYRIGLKKVLTIGTFFYIVYYLLLNLLNGGFDISYIPIAIVYGLSVSLYFSSYHIIFSKCADGKSEAKKFSLLKILVLLTGTAGPLLGALFISNLSFHILFIIVSVFFFLSLLPLYQTEDYKTRHKPDKSVFKIFKQDTKEKGLAYQASAVLVIATEVFWPIFIYNILKELVSLGAIITISSFITVLVLVFLGKVADKDENKTLKIGVFFYSFSWITRMLFISPLGIFLNNFYASLSSLAIEVPFSKKIYHEADKSKNIANYFLFREWNLEIGRLTILTIAFITNNIFWIFILSFFVPYLYLGVTKKKSFWQKFKLNFY